MSKQNISQIIIRPALPSDIDRIYSLELLCFRDPWSRDSHADGLSNPDSVFVVLQSSEGAAVIGFACAVIVLDEAHIHNIAVHPDYRRAGLGGRLVDGLLSEAARRGASRACLEVRASNHPAIRVYEKRGFKIDGVRKKYYQDGEDAVLMSCAY